MDQLILEQLETVNRLNKEVIIMGDFNINYLSNATNLNIKRSFNNLGLTQIIKTATRINEDSSTSIDVIFTNKAANVTNASSFPLPLDGTHLDAVRGLITKRNSTQERQQEELVGAALLRSIRTNGSSPILPMPRT